MKASEVLKILRISRQTLTKYIKTGKVKVITNPSGRYEYEEKSVYSFLNEIIQ